MINNKYLFDSSAYTEQNNASNLNLTAKSLSTLLSSLFGPRRMIGPFLHQSSFLSRSINFSEAGFTANSREFSHTKVGISRSGLAKNQLDRI
ncbi:uncharacterized protein ASCRUDRAFT_95473 [Ascoidea rubescens DSM 1968]|uniref:Uncharacterized protein n=1 Tax=Ascoidea rubescens DSM 1968 TaxID=1344418 RepID=A0A1D2VPA7_9ASCO|nr:hypothetical protein ASCRUDRAFT_95473 [Ascoidea rubescens DSM 1968]ODV63443.1 hypothetical protein ASCRUDRAFT_95473 [Ascoidea rubescens DSM 1968]